MGCFEKPKERILLFTSIIYFVSFCSLYIQLPGLYSRNGVLPVDKLKINDAHTAEDFIKMPNVIRLGHFFGLDKYDSMEIVVVFGILMSLLAVMNKGFRCMSTFIVLWLCHFACYTCGQVFMHFQWDILLIEAGFLAILLAKADIIVVGFVEHTPSDAIVMFLYKWLLFRLMFASGVVKLQSNCPSWWGLQALNHHFETQCLPTPLAFFAHHMPSWVQQLGVVVTYYLEIIAPLMFFLPFKGIRLFSFYTQFLLQICIFLTGNYNFFNLLTMALCYSLLKDSDLRRGNKPEPVVKKAADKKGKKPQKQTAQAKPCQTSCVYATWLSHLASFVLIVASLALAVFLFKLQIEGNTVKAQIGFTKPQFEKFVTEAVRYSCYFAIVSFLGAVYCALKCSVTSDGIIRKFYSLFGTLIISVVGAVILFSSIHVFSMSLAPEIAKSNPAPFGKLYSEVGPYHVINSYGLFRRMTTKRNEVILEVAKSDKGPWTPINFHHKPGRLDKAPTVVVPHQPRLDWQMWFAALSEPKQNGWLYSAMHGILEARPEVLSLMDIDQDFKKPAFIRAMIQEYKFAPMNKLEWPQKWWTTVGAAKQYIPPQSLSSPELKSKLSELGISGTKNSAPSKPNQVTNILKDVRMRIGQPKNFTPVIIVILVLLLTKLRRG